MVVSEKFYSIVIRQIGSIILFQFAKSFFQIGKAIHQSLFIWGGQIVDRGSFQESRNSLSFSFL